MTVQSLEPAVRLIKTRIKTAKALKQKNLSVSTIFKQLRSHEAFSLFGDYLLIGVIVDELQKAGFPVRADALMRLFKKSADLTGEPKNIKQELIGQLLET